MNIRGTKYYIMTFLAGKGQLDEFVAVASVLVQTIAKVYFLWLYTTKYDKFVSIMDQFAKMTYTHNKLKNINKVRINNTNEITA